MGDQSSPGIMPPPPDYYLDALRAVVAWVRRHHGALVDARLSGFLSRLDALPPAAARLHVRLLSRRGPDFRVDRLRYAEVGPAAPAAIALSLAGLSTLHRTPAPALAALRVDELVDRLRPIGALPRDRRRPALLAAAAALLADGVALDLPLLIRCRHRDELDCLRLLYFGGLHQDLTEFVLADLGTLRWPRVALRPRLPWPDAAAVRRSLVVHRLADASHALAAMDPAAPGLADALRELAAALDPAPADPSGRQRRERALLRLAACAAAVDPELELALLERVEAPPARERRCRRLVRSGRGAEAARLVEHMARMPRDASEVHFAGRFDVERGRCRPRRRGAAVGTLVLPAPAPGDALRIEARVASVLARGGNRVLHMENHLPGMLFALGFWDLIHAPRPGAFVQPFQSGPTDLVDGTFCSARRAALGARVEAIAADRYGRTEFLRVLARERGTVNPFWSWPEREVRAVPALLDSIPARVRGALCARVAADTRAARSGFPDLVVANGAGCHRFVEVKGPGDRLRDEQRAWLAHLGAHGIDAGVLEVRWA